VKRGGRVSLLDAPAPRSLDNALIPSGPRICVRVVYRIWNEPEITSRKNHRAGMAFAPAGRGLIANPTCHPRRHPHGP
jgi:hypothetical protein